MSVKEQREQLVEAVRHMKLQHVEGTASIRMKHEMRLCSLNPHAGQASVWWETTHFV
jgi:hypothetical protein